MRGICEFIRAAGCDPVSTRSSDGIGSCTGSPLPTDRLTSFATRRNLASRLRAWNVGKVAERPSDRMGGTRPFARGRGKGTTSPTPAPGQRGSRSAAGGAAGRVGSRCPGCAPAVQQRVEIGSSRETPPGSRAPAIVGDDLRCLPSSASVRTAPGSRTLHSGRRRPSRPPGSWSISSNESDMWSGSMTRQMPGRDRSASPMTARPRPGRPTRWSVRSSKNGPPTLAGPPGAGWAAVVSLREITDPHREVPDGLTGPVTGGAVRRSSTVPPAWPPSGP